jgi:monoamine oxidase
MECDVIVVGAGISGLATADRLAPRADVTVLEARDRIGGRLHSVDRLDLGASWFWPGEQRVAALVNELHVPTHSQRLDGDALYDGPDGAVRLDGNPIDVPAFRFSDGADGLAAALARRLATSDRTAVVLDSHVHTIQISDETHRPVRITYSHLGIDRTIRADHVVIALPPALAVSAIDFHPALPDDIAGLASRTPVWMGTTTKTVAHYRNAFWRRTGHSGSAVSHLGPLREIHDLSGPDGQPAALFGFSPTGAGTDRIDPAAVIAQLVRLFGPSAAEPLAVHVADWRREPLTTPDTADRLTDYSTYGDPRFTQPTFGGRVHWTSTETSPIAPGHIEGALAAAERTVRTITTNSPSQHQQESR